MPYLSFRSDDDYEINIYGDLAHPAGFEVGVYRKLLDAPSAKDNCLRFVSAVLTKPDGRGQIQSLNLQKDLRIFGGVTFEITPPTDPDAYHGWWISVYDEAKINKSRASEEEIRRITLAKTEAAERTNQPSGWTKEEMRLARPVNPQSGVAQLPAVQNSQYSTYTPSSAYATAPSYSSGDRVYVRGYTRKDGTYVAPYTRSAPHGR